MARTSEWGGRADSHLVIILEDVRNHLDYGLPGGRARSADRVAALRELLEALCDEMAVRMFSGRDRILRARLRWVTREIAAANRLIALFGSQGRVRAVPGLDPWSREQYARIGQLLGAPQDTESTAACRAIQQGWRDAARVLRDQQRALRAAAKPAWIGRGSPQQRSLRLIRRALRDLGVRRSQVTALLQTLGLEPTGVKSATTAAKSAT